MATSNNYYRKNMVILALKISFLVFWLVICRIYELQEKRKTRDSAGGIYKELWLTELNVLSMLLPQIYGKCRVNTGKMELICNVHGSHI